MAWYVQRIQIIKDRGMSMRDPHNGFIEARKVSLTALEDTQEKKKSDEPEDFETDILPEIEQEYVSTDSLLLVRNVAYATLEEDDKMPIKEDDKPKDVNQMLYAEALEGKEAVERQKKDALMDYRG